MRIQLSGKLQKRQWTVGPVVGEGERVTFHFLPFSIAYPSASPPRASILIITFRTGIGNSFVSCQHHLWWDWWQALDSQTKITVPVLPVALKHISERASFGPERVGFLLRRVLDTGSKPHVKGVDSWRCQSPACMRCVWGQKFWLIPGCVLWNTNMLLWVFIWMALFGQLKAPFPRQVVVMTLVIWDLYFRQWELVTSHNRRNTGSAFVLSLATAAPWSLHYSCLFTLIIILNVSFLPISLSGRNVFGRVIIKEKEDFLPLINQVEDAVSGGFKSLLNQPEVHHEGADCRLQGLVSAPVSSVKLPEVSGSSILISITASTSTERPRQRT